MDRLTTTFTRQSVLKRLPELTILILVVLVAGGIWLFVGIADEVAEGDTHAVDKTVLLSLRAPDNPAQPLGPPWVEETARDITALGSFSVLGLLTLTACGYLFIQRRHRMALLVVVAIGGGMAISAVLKTLFDRPRPDLVPHEAMYTTSFPSQHSMLSAIVYLTLAALLARVQPTAALRAYLLVIAVFLAVIIGISRVYLGVHWPSDVLAGWAAGGAWACLCWLVARRLQRRGEVEGADGEEGVDAAKDLSAQR